MTDMNTMRDQLIKNDCQHSHLHLPVGKGHDIMLLYQSIAVNVGLILNVSIYCQAITV